MSSMRNKSGSLELIDRFPAMQTMRWRYLRKVRVGGVLFGRRDCMLVEVESLPANVVDFGRICIIASRLVGDDLYSTRRSAQMNVYVCSIHTTDIDKSVFQDSEVRVAEWAVVSFD
jgi:hypothetical protein